MENKKFLVKWSTVVHYEAEVEAADWIDAEDKYWAGEVEWAQSAQGDTKLTAVDELKAEGTQ
tara:strand:+ start:164 stop:349 length:186 start_codon:yes stop_codon:yes gene_type:complete